MIRKIVFAALALALPLSAHAEGSVVRPQKYTAGNKFELTPEGGYVSNDPYYRIIAPGVMLTYHYGERSAIEGHVFADLNSPKPLLNQVRQKINRDPEVVSRPKVTVTGDYMWSPVYGKLNAFGEVVLHYDFFVLGGLGVCQDEIETNTPATPSQQSIASKVFPVTDIGMGQHFFFTRHVALRVEVRPIITWENINNKFDPNGDVQINLGLSLLL